MAINPIQPPADAASPATAATQAPLEAVAPVDLASPDNAPLAAQIAALRDAQNSPTTSTRIKTVLQRAFALLGTPYRWGGTSPERGFDCSGLVNYVYRDMLDMRLPRTSRDLAAMEGPRIATDRLSGGDLVFFGSGGTVSHVGIYVGEGRFVHAPNSGGTVRLDRLDGSWWRDHYRGARRLLN